MSWLEIKSMLDVVVPPVIIVSILILWLIQKWVDKK